MSIEWRRVAQVFALLAALAVVGFGALQISSHRVRVGLVAITIGTVFVVAVVLLLLAGRGGSKFAAAPGHGLVLSGRHLLHDYVAGLGQVTSYQLDLYGSPVAAAQVASELDGRLSGYGYRAATPTHGPILRYGNATEIAQFDLDEWRWRVYELPLPTRFAGVNYSTRDFAHLVAVTLSNDGS